jgi:hypothetical protein
MKRPNFSLMIRTALSSATAIALLVAPTLANAGCKTTNPNMGTRTGTPPTLPDTCFTASPSPTDSNGDGFGNLCDADYNQDCNVNVADFMLFLGAFTSTYDPDMDHSEPADAIVGAADFVVFATRFGSTPD